MARFLRFGISRISMFQIYHTNIIAIIIINSAQFVKRIELCKMREYRKELARFELIKQLQSEKQTLKTVCYKKVPFPNMARTNGMDCTSYPMKISFIKMFLRIDVRYIP